MPPSLLEAASGPRCAIYARKSHEERVDSQFGSIEAQRELCERYVGSQAGEGWSAIPEHFADEGYSGGTLKRPALARLLTAIEAGQVDIVVVYKIDRLSRSLRDFLDLVALFEARGVTFVAITQAFNTTSSMGRLTLNVLLSFAQFEREVTGERLRDWFAGARSRGLWTNGLPPFGYDVRDLRLEVNPEQAEAVRFAFRRYPVLGSSRAIAEEITARGHLNRGRPFSTRVVNHMLHNRIYRGELVYQGQALPGQHEAIVTEAEFQRAQRRIAQSPRRRVGVHGRRPGMLQDVIFGHGGRRLIHVTQHRRGKAYRYYLPSTVRYRVAEYPNDRYRAGELEAAVVERLSGLAATPLGDLDWYVAVGQVRRLVSRVDVEPAAARVTLVTGAHVLVAHTAACQSSSAAQPICPRQV